MSLFRYNVMQGGERREGVVKAASERAAAEQLRRSGASVLSLTEMSAASGMAGSAEQWGRLWYRIWVRSQSIEIVLRQMGALLHSGVPILTVLKALARTAPAPLRKALECMVGVIREGKPFSQAAAQYMPGIDRVTIGLLGVGEANGTLDRMASHAADMKEESRKMREQILQAFSYPAFVMVAAMGVGAFMVRKVFPEVMKFIESSRRAVNLPLPTRMVIGLDHFLSTYGLYILLAPVVITALVLLLRKSARSGRMVDAVALRLPLLGKAFQYHSNAMWCSTLGSLLGSGLDVLAAVDLVQGTMSNWVYAAQFDRVRELLREGVSLSSSIEATKLKRLTPMAYTLVSVSEEGGHMDESLIEVARYSRDQLNRRVVLLSKLMEPAVFIVVGGFVGLIYFGFFLAVLAATQAAR